MEDSTLTDELIRNLKTKFINDPGRMELDAAATECLLAGCTDVGASIARGLSKSLIGETAKRNSNLRARLSYYSGRSSLFPPGLFRECIREAGQLAEFIQEEAYEQAINYASDPTLVSNSTYNPKFAALCHITRYRIDCEYADSFDSTSIFAKKLEPYFSEPEKSAELMAAIETHGNWQETKVDNKVIGKSCRSISFQKEPALEAFFEAAEPMLEAMLMELMKGDHIRKTFNIDDLDGLWERSDVYFESRVNVQNELDPLLKSHYHSGVIDSNAFSAKAGKWKYPVLSAVFYPFSVPNPNKEGDGAISFGRTEFDNPDRDIRVRRIQPVGGMLLGFPAFLYHEVEPFLSGPRVSIAFDLTVYKPE